ncbi:interferon-induced very large GTPase 1-like [Osmerus mordax]|uniref:interferon-induced very large GTPase 1-like n=1 Tax=Osmerus mordax TaxID=8014 RepID=UPI00350F9B20
MSVPPPPGEISFLSVKPDSVTLTWGPPEGLEGSRKFRVTWEGDGTHKSLIVTDMYKVEITALQPGQKYDFRVATEGDHGNHSNLVSASTYTDKLTVVSVDATSVTVSWEQPGGMDQTQLQYQVSYQSPGTDQLTTITTSSLSMTLSDLRPASEYSVRCSFFLRELMKANVLARDKLSNLSDEKDLVNPLDLITALFLCSGHFLQQEIALKMSLCQFAVPLLLPNHDTQQITLMLWAMRDIVKKYTTPSKEFVEDSVVLANLPMVSFVRLGYSSLSKSELLNGVLSKSQQTNRSFVHRNMTGGNSPRQISDGLVEVTWYFPCGKLNTDVFSEPVAVANLCGDIQDFPIQFEFLCKTSAAVFVFCDCFTSDINVPVKHLADRQFFVVSNTEAKGYDAAAFEHILQLKQSVHIKKDSQMNNFQLVHKLHSVVREVVKANPVKFSVEKMAEEANKFNIHVDEDFKLCQAGRKTACSITDHISDISDFKNKHLPLHGEILVELVKVEREQSKHKNAGKRNIEEYKSELRMKQNELRTKQVNKGVNNIMTTFIDALKNSEQCCFFLKWMKINLDNHSREHLSKLREKYKNLCESSSGDETKISDLGKIISSSSLGIEHFLRELGQLYESAQSLPENHPTLRQYEQLPRICAQVMLDGFPLELIDGDASYIPMKWISDVLRELHSLTSCNSKVRVITVLGVQSSGKSTLLNTMFGVQFAVSDGRCTRGAFMQLIRVEEDLKEQLDCDFIMVIDTEGLKAPELAQLDNSYEHDNELATLVVGLSDITIINIAMENAAEMKDILQIVVHAFLRMKEVGKKHMCQFVHQNVPDCSAHTKNANDRRLVLQQLNEMTEVAAKMERKEHNKRFTDIMDYDPEKHSCYLPGLWHGNPPMAPVNAGYSEAVSELKKSIIQRLVDAKTPGVSILQFCERTKDVWNAVKHENFIFSFRNSLEAVAYNMLSVEFNGWELDLRNHMQNWWQQAEAEISNHGTVASSVGTPSHLEDLKECLKHECTSKLEEEVKALMQKLTQYLEQKQKSVHLLGKYREDFVNSIHMLKMETKNSLRSKVDMAVECKKDQVKIEGLKETQSDKMEEQVIKLLDKCRNNQKHKRSELRSEELKKEFDQTWDTTVKSLDIRGLHKQDIDTDILRCLRNNMERKASSAQEIINEINRLDKASDLNEDCIAKSKNWFQKENKNKTMEFEIKLKCKRFIDEKLSAKSDYHSTYTIHILKLIDDSLEKIPDLHTDADFEANLKIQICGHASREFQKMQTTFLEANDPLKCLENFKPEYFRNFKDLFYQRDQCDRKAEDFSKLCLEPAVKEHVNKSLGLAIVKKVMNETNAGIEFRTRTFFQFSILKSLFKGEFEQFERYINEYSSFVEAWIFQRIVDFFSGDHTIADLEDKQLEKITGKIEDVIKDLEAPPNEGDTKTDACSFIEAICQTLSKDLVIPQDALKSVLHLNKAQTKQFSDCLKIYVREMKQSLSAEYHEDTDLRAKLENLPLKPQEELFDRLFGCGKTCPFCRAPCEAAGRGHKEHFVTIHRPQGLGNWQNDSKHLLLDICSSRVASEMRFSCSDTNDVFHPYKDYRSIYPHWRIQPDPSIEASDYWKYVFAKYNQKFADKYKALPADIPAEWHGITQEQAMESLEKVYRLKAQ